MATTSPARSEDASATTRQRIVTATAELFRRQGYRGTALKDITRAAEATTGSVYHFFPGGKAELARAVVIETGVAYRELFELIAGAAGSAAQAVADFFDGAAEVLAQSGYLDVCPIGAVAREVASTDDELRAATAQVFDSWTKAAAARLRADGIDSRTARELALVVVALLEGGFTLARAHRDAAILRRLGRQARSLVAAATP
ncbi:MAG: TetR/AcrR family transcriptional regulator [Acidimicrobiales bacterium]